MKQLDNENISDETLIACATCILDTLPRVMNILRSETRQQRPEELTLPQFRALTIVGHYEGATLCAVAEHLGLTPSTASKTIDYLVQRHLMTRENDTQDRRRTHLRLTADGAATLAIIRESALRLIIRHLTQLTDGERRQIGASLELLLTAFQSAPEYLADAVTRETASTEAAVDRKALASPQHPE